MQRNPLVRLRDFGQSVWCDDIGRDLLCTGKLQELIAEDGVSGLTSNPTIFHRAITGSSTYDKEINSLIATGAGTTEILESLVLKDVGLAAAALRHVFDNSGSRDGWVSVEVAPAFAYDAQGTVAEVKRLRALLDYPNILVKVPGTGEGVRAVRKLVAMGYSINVTLIFSLSRYQEVMEAYLLGLEELAARRAAGESAPGLDQVHGVASFFVSRMDGIVDRRLDSLAAQALAVGKDPSGYARLKGKAAVANAKMAYRLFQQAFSGQRWEVLRAQGANLQRPLWASTSTKNPDYSDILYVQELIGRDTVTTMPLNTMAAFRDHGEPAETLTAGVDEAEAHLRALESEGIRMADLSTRLELEGVRTFADSHEALFVALDERRRLRGATIGR